MNLQFPIDSSSDATFHSCQCFASSFIFFAHDKSKLTRMQRRLKHRNAVILFHTNCDQSQVHSKPTTLPGPSHYPRPAVEDDGTQPIKVFPPLAALAQPSWPLDLGYQEENAPSAYAATSSSPHYRGRGRGVWHACSGDRGRRGHRRLRVTHTTLSVLHDSLCKSIVGREEGSGKREKEREGGRCDVWAIGMRSDLENLGLTPVDDPHGWWCVPFCSS